MKIDLITKKQVEELIKKEVEKKFKSEIETLWKQINKLYDKIKILESRL